MAESLLVRSAGTAEVRIGSRPAAKRLNDFMMMVEDVVVMLESGLECACLCVW